MFLNQIPATARNLRRAYGGGSGPNKPLAPSLKTPPTAVRSGRRRPRPARRGGFEAAGGLAGRKSLLFGVGAMGGTELRVRTGQRGWGGHDYSRR